MSFVPVLCAPAYCTTIHFPGFHTSAASADETVLPSLTDTAVIAGFINVNFLYSCVDAPDTAEAST